MKHSSKMAFTVLLLGAGCASQKPRTLDPTPAGQDSVQVVSADAAARSFQGEADQIKGASARDWQDVARRMEGVTQKHPKYGLAWYNLGVAHDNLGNSRKAGDAYRRALVQNDALREAQENLASLAIRTGETSEAVALLRELVARDPAASDARVALASHQLTQGDLDEAKKLCQDALTYQPKHLDAFCVLSDIAVREKDYARARLLAAQGFKISEDAACLHLVLGRVAMVDNETAVARVEMERAVELDPKLVEAHFRIAEISMGYKDFKKAIDSYGRVAKANPKNTAAWVNLGVAYKGSGQFEKAEQAYQSAVKASDEAQPAVHYNLGVLYLRHLRRLDDAERELKHFLTLSDGAGDRAFALLEEIEKLRMLAEEEKRMEAEMARQSAIDEKIAKEQAVLKVEEDRLRAEEASRAASEPTGPSAESETPAIAPKAVEPPKKRKGKGKRGKKAKTPKKPKLVIPDADDFE